MKPLTFGSTTAARKDGPKPAQQARKTTERVKRTFMQGCEAGFHQRNDQPSEI
ncbi:hypothetical protein [Prosthecobacter sp.]|uniref:hypothetical protein n=1 Tax=Prosthecobacter sp. TaxID=1965333 RepID=UPI003904D26E